MRTHTGLARIGLLVIGAIPAIISFVAGHVVVSILLFVVGEVVATASLLASGVIKGLGNRWRDRIIETLDQSILRWASRFAKRYHNFIVDTNRKIEQQGPATNGFYRPELDEVFVDLGLIHKAPHQVSSSLLSDWPDTDVGNTGLSKRHSIDHFIDKPDAQVLAILGAPGSGKTTLLRRTAREISRNQRTRRRRIPILLYLRDHVDLINRNPEVDVSALVRRELGRLGLEAPVGWFERKLRAGGCVVLLDGLDEIARTDSRKTVAKWIELQTRRYPRNDFIVTSRPQGYLAAPIDEASVLKVRNFTGTQVEKFVKQWYKAIEHQGEKSEASHDATTRATRGANNLLDRLSAAPALYDLTVNPLLLTMIVNVHYHRSALPGSRVDLYNEICEVMLWRRQEAKQLTVYPDGNKKKNVLSMIAFNMMERETRDLSTQEIIQLIRLGLRRVPGDVTPEDFLADVGSNGLVVERENGKFAFAHLTFQEYLASSYIMRMKKKDDKGFAMRVDSSWWRETMLLYAAKSDADEIVQACLQKDTVTALSLAIDCVDQGSELEPQLRDQVEGLLTSASQPDMDPERRKLMSGVLLNRHLRGVVRTGTGSRVCVNPITAGLFDLFRRDTEQPAPDAPEGAENDPRVTAVGVRSEDAVKFVRWTNSVLESQTPYQVVAYGQLLDPIAQAALQKEHATASFWTRSGDEAGELSLWIPPDSPHPHEVSRASLVEHVVQDITVSMPSLVRLLLLRSLIDGRRLTLELEADFAKATSKGVEQKRFDVDLARAKVRGRFKDRAIVHRAPLEVIRSTVKALDLYNEFTQIQSLYTGVVRANAQARQDAVRQSVEVAEQLIAGIDTDFAKCFSVPASLTPSGASDLVTDNVLHRIFDQAIDQSTGYRDWKTALAECFVLQTLTSRWPGSRIDPESLVGKVRTAKAALIDFDGDSDDSDESDGADEPPPWIRKAVAAVEEASVPVFARQRTLSPKLASTIRLSTLCLAAERIPLRSGITGELFREIAAGVTLLERRASGAAQPSEAILLAPE